MADPILNYVLYNEKDCKEARMSGLAGEFVILNMEIQ